MSRVKTNANRRNNNNKRCSDKPSVGNAKYRNSKGGKSIDKDRFEDTRYTTEGSNDPSWYATDPALLRDSANIAFSYPNGRPIDMAVPGQSHVRQMPGLLTIELLPSAGWSMDPHSPINVASMSMYTFVRKNKAGNLPFDAPDLMCYSLAMADMYSYINFMQRIYGLASLYSQQNLYIPRALVEANHVDFDDVIANLANFRYGINVLINKAASLAAPSNLTLFVRRAFLYQNLYTEGTSIRDQLYMYVPRGFWAFRTEDASGTRLQCKPFGAHTYTVAELLEYGNTLITGIIDDADAQTMSAFIYEAYGPDGILKLQSMPESYAIAPIYDIGVLEQMKNAVVAPSFNILAATMVSCGISQDETKGYLTSWPQLGIVKKDFVDPEKVMNLMCGKKFLTTSSANPDAALIMESSRLMMQGKEYVPGEGDNGSMTVYSGSEIAVKCVIWSYKEGMVLDFGEVGYLTRATGVEAACKIASGLSSFKFHPEVNLLVEYLNGTYKVFDVSDLDNFTVITDTDLIRLHEAALMNEFNVPKIGKLS